MLIGDVSAWAALAGALLSIGIEIWKLRRVRRGSPAEDQLHDEEEEEYPRFFRGISPSSLIPIAALILAAQALGLYSEELLLRASLESDKVAAIQLTSLCTFVRTIGVLTVFTTIILSFRVVGRYFLRLVKFTESVG